MLGRVSLVRADVSEELSASFISVTRIGELRTTITVTSNRRTLRRNTAVMQFGDGLLDTPNAYSVFRIVQLMTRQQLCAV
jgi:hypothetical protein